MNKSIISGSYNPGAFNTKYDFGNKLLKENSTDFQFEDTEGEYNEVAKLLGASKIEGGAYNEHET